MKSNEVDIQKITESLISLPENQIKDRLTSIPNNYYPQIDRCLKELGAKFRISKIVADKSKKSKRRKTNKKKSKTQKKLQRKIKEMATISFGLQPNPSHPCSYQEILEVIKSLKNNSGPIRHFSTHSANYTIPSLHKELCQLDAQEQADFLLEFSKLVDGFKNKHQIINKLTTSLENAYPEEDFYIDDFAIYDKDYYGIKIYMCGKAYLIEFDGTVDELIDSLKEEVEVNYSDIIKCPFCDQEYIRCKIISDEQGKNKCNCGSIITTETSRPHGRLSILAQNMRKHPHAVSVGCGNTNWETWFIEPGFFLEPPTSFDVEANSLEDEINSIQDSCMICNTVFSKTRLPKLCNCQNTLFCKNCFDAHQHTEIITTSLPSEALTEEEAVQHNDDLLNYKTFIEKCRTEGARLYRYPYDDILITKEYLNVLRQKLYSVFCEWVTGGETLELDHRDDSPWDHSGSLVVIEESIDALLNKYETIEDWMNDEYTGSSMASFQSGCGLYYQTYDTKIDEITSEMASDILKTGIDFDGCDKCERHQKTDSWTDDCEDWYMEGHLYDSAVVSLQFCLLDFCRKITTKEAFEFGIKRFKVEQKLAALLEAIT